MRTRTSTSRASKLPEWKRRFEFLLEGESKDPSRAEVRRGMVRAGLLRLREWPGGVLHTKAAISNGDLTKGLSH